MYKFVCFIYSRSILYVKKQEIRNKIFPKEGVCPVCAGRKNREKLPPLLSQDIVQDAAFLAIKTINNFVLFSQSKVYWNAKDGFQ